jgi:hypothetical protein
VIIKRINHFKRFICIYININLIQKYYMEKILVLGKVEEKFKNKYVLGIEGSANKIGIGIICVILRNCGL